MKRLFPMIVAALAAAAIVTTTGTAGGAMGPPCTNVVGGGDTLGYGAPGDGTGAAEASFILAASSARPGCAEASYRLDIYSFDGTTLLVSNLAPTSISGETVFFHYDFASGAPSAGVCLVGATYLRGRLADRVPDSGCAPVENGSSGGFSGWN